MANSSGDGTGPRHQRDHRPARAASAATATAPAITAITYEFRASTARPAKPPKGRRPLMSAAHGRTAARCARSQKECRNPAMEGF